MSETKFTPGPWYVGIDDDDGTPFIEICKGECPSKEYKDIAKVNSTLDTNTDEFVITDEDRANASLIAAAPELYEALDEIVDYFGGADHALDDPYVMKRVRVSLAKARGESEKS